MTTLHAACREGLLDKVEEYINESENREKLIDSKDEDERTVRCQNEVCEFLSRQYLSESV